MGKSNAISLECVGRKCELHRVLFEIHTGCTLYEIMYINMQQLYCGWWWWWAEDCVVALAFCCQNPNTAAPLCCCHNHTLLNTQIEGTAQSNTLALALTLAHMQSPIEKLYQNKISAEYKLNMLIKHHIIFKLLVHHCAWEGAGGEGGSGIYYHGSRIGSRVNVHQIFINSTNTKHSRAE